MTYNDRTHRWLVALAIHVQWSAIFWCRLSTCSLRTFFLPVTAASKHLTSDSNWFLRLPMYWLFTVCFLASRCSLKRWMSCKRKMISYITTLHAFHLSVHWEALLQVSTTLHQFWHMFWVSALNSKIVHCSILVHRTRGDTKTPVFKG